MHPLRINTSAGAKPRFFNRGKSHHVFTLNLPALRLLACILIILMMMPVVALSEANLPVTAVLSSQSGPYRDALTGLELELGTTIQSFVLSQDKPKINKATRVVAAFGSKAALLNYPDNVILVYAMAPGTAIETKNSIGICMEPDAAVLLANLRIIQPNLKRLGVLWQSLRFENYIRQLRKASAPLNISIESVHLTNNKDVPDNLRTIYGKIDAIWLPPDPLLLNAASLAVFMEFSRSNHIPLFVPTRGLAEEGAAASVGPSFREIGRLTGIAVRQTLANLHPGNNLYAVNIELIINKSAAAQVGLKIPEEILRKADKVIP